MPVAGVVEEQITIPEGVTAELRGAELVLTGKSETLRRRLHHPRITLQLEGRELRIRCEEPRRRERALVGTYGAHVRNMIRGITDGFEYRMKVVFSHFPVKVLVKDGEVQIENFLGERFPRRAVVRGRTRVAVQGDVLVLKGPAIEDVGQTAANIEQATKIRGFDPRVFQDGIYITKKSGEE